MSVTAQTRIASFENRTVYLCTTPRNILVMLLDNMVQFHHGQAEAPYGRNGYWGGVLHHPDLNNPTLIQHRAVMPQYPFTNTLGFKGLATYQ